MEVAEQDRWPLTASFFHQHACKLIFLNWKRGLSFQVAESPELFSVQISLLQRMTQINLGRRTHQDGHTNPTLDYKTDVFLLLI